MKWSPMAERLIQVPFYFYLFSYYFCWTVIAKIYILGLFIDLSAPKLEFFYINFKQMSKYLLK